MIFNFSRKYNVVTLNGGLQVPTKDYVFKAGLNFHEIAHLRYRLIAERFDQKADYGRVYDKIRTIGI